MEYLFLKNETETANIPMDMIISLEVKDYYLVCHTVCGRDFCCSKSLNKIEGELPSHFIQINRNIIVNLQKVQLLNFKERTIYMNGQLAYQMAIRRMKAIRKAINEYESDRYDIGR
ncbi:LytTR family transcriptional regulator [Echinicola soli]|uniref:LytTR family transcriptional regulator n=1 Tax=Echinicola soli TaxID=2591634 RepID=A0A514CGS3_9BACT|nr:LytTR family DNA-binding domain-containing protein [Echinicola soli]QDH79017.1 LytTR family transcriptional regulator [Echinicola soli]